MKFIWDENKNQINSEKHGISFERAIEAWGDPLGFDLFDEKHSSIEEDRWFYFGKMKNGEIIRVVYTELTGEVYRIITAYSDEFIRRIYNEENE